MKRQLPTGGRYRLELRFLLHLICCMSYFLYFLPISLPLYQWRTQIKAAGGHPFWSLLKLLGERRFNKPNVDITEEELPQDDHDGDEEEDDNTDSCSTETSSSEDEREDGDKTLFCMYCQRSFDSTYLIEQHLRFCRK